MIKEIEIGEVQQLLEQGKTVKVLTLGGEYTRVTKFIDKGVLKTYSVLLENGNSIKCSANHLFYANTGWIKAIDLLPGKTKLMTETTKFVTVEKVDYIGEYPIVDISVEHPEECYYGNGILNHNSGKSLVAAHLLADTQRKGGQAIFIDTEFAVSPEFLTAIGVDVNKMLYVNAVTVEDIFDNIELLVSKIRTANKNRLVTIVVDSMAAASTKKEMASDHGADGFATNKAIAISKAMRKITEMIARERICLVFTNQLRQKIGFVGFGDPWTTSGGKALAFHASVRIRLKSTGSIKNGDQPVGIKTKAVVIKNRMGPPLRGCEFNIFFDRGIDGYGSWLETLIDNKVVTPAKIKKDEPGVKKTKKQQQEELAEAKKTKSLQVLLPLGDGTEEQVVFEKKDFPTLVNSREDIKKYLYDNLCDICIMKYKSPESVLEDDVEVDSSQEGIDE